MQKTFVIILLSITSILAHSQIDNNSFDTKYLEHLIKIKIDSVRKTHGCKPLVNDSILYIASLHHSNFMLENKRLSHYESDDSTKTPQLRAEYYGAKNYLTGENVLKTRYNTTIKTKDNREINTLTYEQLALSIVIGWVNSPGHFKNIITPKYQITGVSVAVDTEKNVLYSCQKFAKVMYKYSFEKDKSMFPYSEYTVPEPITSFAEVEYDSTHSHEWGLKHNELSKCSRCKLLGNTKPDITLKFENNSFRLRIENSEYVKQLVRDKYDGFAVEIVELDDYMCGNPNYYTKPSRRNGQCRLNGRVLKPLYREDLYKGYKGRKAKKEVTFLSYMLGADSVAFFDRYHRYKIEKYSSKYFDIKLARLPKDIEGQWAHYNYPKI